MEKNVLRLCLCFFYVIIHIIILKSISVARKQATQGNVLGMSCFDALPDQQAYIHITCTVIITEMPIGLISSITSAQLCSIAAIKQFHICVDIGNVSQVALLHCFL